jgi:Protein of unknown function (DUF2612)
VQLDGVGERIGRSRHFNIPLAGVYFSWDDPLRGWDQAVWKGPYDTAIGITQLDDETYRRLLRANIMAKRWDGTVPGAQTAFEVFFTDPATHVFVQDNAQAPFPRVVFAWDVESQGWDQGEWHQEGALVASAGTVDVSMTICVSGKIPDTVGLAILGQGGIPIKPGGVTTDYAVTSVDETPLFGWDVENEFISGWDVGAWGVSPQYLLTNDGSTAPAVIAPVPPKFLAGSDLIQAGSDVIFA